MHAMLTTLALALAIAPVERVSGGSDPFADDAERAETSSSGNGATGTSTSTTPPNQLPSGAQPSNPEGAPEPLGGAARATIPGVPPGVELFDESTWTSLSVEEKDRLRAIRAEILYQQRQAAGPTSAPTAPAPRIDPSDRPPRNDGYARRAHREEWEARDTSLATTTAVMGVLWGVGLVTTVVLAVQAKRKVDECSDAIDAAVFDARACTSAVRTARALSIGAWFSGTVATGAGVGTIVAGSFLGAHRSRGPSVATAHARRLAISRGGVGFRF